MNRLAQTYRPLLPRRWFAIGRRQAWRANDHLLIIEQRWLSEFYTRFYWADIETLALYALPRDTSAFVILEIACVLTAVVPLALWKMPWAFAPAVLFALFYAAWRFTRPVRACRIATRASSKRFPIPGTAVACRRVLDELKQCAAAAQNASPEMTIASGEMVTGEPLNSTRPKQPILAAHVIAFVLGVFSPFHVLLFVFYCIALAAAYFFEQDFEFPFPVRSAAVMGRLLAALQIAFWIFAIARLSYVARFPFDHWQFGASRVLICLYGIAAVCWPFMQGPRPERKTARVLGLS